MNHRRPQDTAADGWPPVITASRLNADGYSYSTLDRAERAGLLRRFGRVGGTGQRVYAREDVLAWLAGATAANTTTTRPTPPVRRAPAVGDALERIARAAGGSK